MSASNWITVALFAVTMFMGGLTAYYGYVRSMEKRVTIIEQRCINHQIILDSIAQLNSRIEKVSNDSETFWKILGPHLAGIIHSPKSRERDELVDELVAGSIDCDGAVRLQELLMEAITSNRWDGNKRLAGALLLARTRSRISLLDAQKTVGSDVAH